MAFQFALPGRVFLGQNALIESEPAIKALGQKALIITGKHVMKAGPLTALTECLTQWTIAYEVYSEITGEPTVDMITKGVATYRKTGCDFLIGIGGGSPQDSAKAIAAMSVLPGVIADYMGKEIEGKFPPMVLIPTTAGTGSEATKFTIITDPDKGVKMLLKGNSLLPDIAIIDPQFTLTTPPEITVATGMDALTHAVEAYTSRKASPLTDVYALSAIRRIFAYLPKAYENGSDLQAREQMSIAAFEAGVCINNASVTLVHGMSRPIGALFHVPHGMSNAVLLKECLTFALDGSYERFGQIGRVIGVADHQSDNQQAAQAFLQALSELCKKLKIPNLEQLGIQRQAFDAQKDKMAQDAINSGSPANTIKPVSKEDLIEIYNQLW